jgi:hypothetical protein
MPPQTSPRPYQKPSRDAIIRAVASSTAIETGQPIVAIEAQLRSDRGKFPHLALALKPASPPARGRCGRRCRYGRSRDGDHIMVDKKISNFRL